MKNQILISLLMLLFTQAIAAAEILRVPSRTYPNIQSGLNAANNGDLIMVKPGVYSGSGNRNLDFKGKSIILQSEINPANPDWDIIADTIIDCGGKPPRIIGSDKGAANRAFWFHSGEGPNSVVMGFTIRNGYSRGHKGRDGTPGLPDQSTWLPPMHDGVTAPFHTPWFGTELEDPCDPPIADYGQDSPYNARGYAGAILCGRDGRNRLTDLGASPTIKYCIIEDCTVTGGEGGRGADGISGGYDYFVWPAYDLDHGGGMCQWPYLLADPVVPCDYDVTDDEIPEDREPATTTNGQWGGRGGDGYGIGCGAGIACRTASSPIISDCIFRNNIAHGGVGGDGGNGGSAAGSAIMGWDGDEGAGGDAGLGVGDGQGGVIYAAGGSNPIVANCTFGENTATMGIGGKGGARGGGNEADPRAPAGMDAIAVPSGHISGGAAYYGMNTSTNFTNCTFSNNNAYEVSLLYQLYELYGLGEYGPAETYTVGGALYFDQGNQVNLNNCDFIDNLGGAVYLGNHGGMIIHNSYDPNRPCLFVGNSDVNDGSDLEANENIDFGSGGAVHIDADCNVTLRGCDFTNNSAKNEGGAVKCGAGTFISLTECSLSSNTSGGYGGAIDLYGGRLVTMDANSCDFVGNQALYGGALSGEVVEAVLNNCYFSGNTAGEGGALDVVFGDFQIEGGGIIGNVATTYDGGGIYCQDSNLSIVHTAIRGNSANGPGGSGGAIDFDGRASHLIKNCLIVDNSADGDGGAIGCYRATPQIENCTFNRDIAGGYGGAVFANWDSLPQITRSIITTCNNHAIHEEDPSGDAMVTETLFYGNAGGDYYDSGTHLTYSGPSEVNSIPDSNSSNKYGAPLFVNGNLGEYYLSQLDANDPADSPAVNAGSVTAASVGLDMFTTHRFNKPDLGNVDWGYHYPAIGIRKFSLTLGVIGGGGTVELTSPEPVSYDANTGVYQYYGGTVVTLTASPDYGWRVKAWYGTDDDSSTDSTNTVTMSSNRAVSVRFEEGNTLIVAVGGGEDYYGTITDAIHDAVDGDTIVVYPGTYYGGYMGDSVVINKPVVIRSLYPDDPDCVASTIIDGYRQSAFNEGWTNLGVIIGADAVLDGITVRNCGGRWGGDAEDGDRAEGHPNGYDGGVAYAGGIHVNKGVSAIIRRCVIEDNVTIGGDGGAGVGADDSHNAGRGGWGGWAYGGGVYCAPNSKAEFIKCQIIDNWARGGNGGNGGADSDPGGEENYGGSWSRAEVIHWDPFDTSWEFVEGDLWAFWQADPWYNNTRRVVYMGGSYVGDYRWYSAYGGGVFCGEGSDVTFVDCTINGNRTEGGVSGQGGPEVGGRFTEPLVPYELPTFGAGVYCGADSNVAFIRCALTDNIASEPNLNNHHLDPYLGHGGGVCAEESALVAFIDCELSENESSVGGGLHFGAGEAIIIDSDFISNVSYQGGGVFGTGGQMMLSGCRISSNESVVSTVIEPNDPNVELLGYGGGLSLHAVEANIFDCEITENSATASGGGLYLNGESTYLIGNCLVANNSAVKTGGGLANNLFSEVLVANSTIAYNSVTGSGSGSLGGGLHCSDSGAAEVIDSIFWGNSGSLGSQIAVTEGPATVTVDYSGVQNGAVGVFVGANCILNWLMTPDYEGALGDPRFVSGDLGEFGGSGDFFLSQPAASSNQTVLSSYVDAGSDTAHALDLYRHTSRTDGVIDGFDPCDFPDSYGDLGYHYVLTSDLVSDFDYDGDVDGTDFYRFNLHWLDVGCGFPDWCHGKDLNQDGRVNMEDYALFAENFWLSEDTPPTPNPMTWAIPPFSPQMTVVKMVATRASDNSGLPVEYKFERVYPDYYSWAWDPCETHQDSGRTTGTKYGYRVRARDASVIIPDDGTGEPGNKTDWSFVGYAVAGEIQMEDRTPPSPNPMTWAIQPYAASATSASMRATTASDVSTPVEYFFEEITNLPGGDDSPGWQTEATYTDIGLMTGVEYRYRVKARDGSMWHNETEWSSTVAVVPEAGVIEDVNAPRPVMWDPNAVNGGEPYETGDGLNAWVHMTALVATDPEGAGVQYYFECVDIPGVYPSGYSSGWIDLPTWNVGVGRTNQGLRFRFRVRDLSPNLNTSGWSTTLPAYPAPY